MEMTRVYPLPAPQRRLAALQSVERPLVKTDAVRTFVPPPEFRVFFEASPEVFVVPTRNASVRAGQPL